MNEKTSGQRQRGDGHTAPNTASAKHGDRDAQHRSTAERSRAGGRSAAGGGTWALHTPRWLRKHPRAAEPPGCGPSPARGRSVTFAPGSAPESSRGASTSGAGEGGSLGLGGAPPPPLPGGAGAQARWEVPGAAAAPRPSRRPGAGRAAAPPGRGLARACHFLPRREGGGLGRGAAGRRGGGCGEVLPGQPTPPPPRPLPAPALARVPRFLPAPVAMATPLPGLRALGRSGLGWVFFSLVFFFFLPWLWFSFSSFLPPFFLSEFRSPSERTELRKRWPLEGLTSEKRGRWERGGK